MIHRKVFFIAMLPCIVFVGVVSAENDKNSVYIGGGFSGGSARVKASNRYWMDWNDNKSGYNIFAGYDILDFIGIEGSLSLSNDINVNDAISANIYFLTTASKFSFAVNKSVSLYAKTGLSYSVYVENYSNQAIENGLDQQTWKGITPYFGVGTQIKLRDKLEMRMAYEHIKGRLEASSSVGTFNISLPGSCCDTTSKINVHIKSYELSALYRF